MANPVISGESTPAGFSENRDYLNDDAEQEEVIYVDRDGNEQAEGYEGVTTVLRGQDVIDFRNRQAAQQDEQKGRKGTANKGRE